MNNSPENFQIKLDFGKYLSSDFASEKAIGYLREARDQIVRQQSTPDLGKLKEIFEEIKKAKDGTAAMQNLDNFIANPNLIFVQRNEI